MVQAEGRISVKAFSLEPDSFPHPKSEIFQIISWRLVEGGGSGREGGGPPSLRSRTAYGAGLGGGVGIVGRHARPGWLESWMRWDVQVEGRASELVGLGKGRDQPGTHLAGSTAQKHSGA